MASPCLSSMPNEVLDLIVDQVLGAAYADAGAWQTSAPANRKRGFERVKTAAKSVTSLRATNRYFHDQIQKRGSLQLPFHGFPLQRPLLSVVKSQLQMCRVDFLLAGETGGK